MSNYDEIAELTWENGQLSMHGLSGLVPPDPTKPLWARASGTGTLESIVHQGTRGHHPNPSLVMHDSNPSNRNGASNGRRKSMEISCELQMGLKPRNKRSRSECSPNQKYSTTNVHNLCVDRSACASAGATFCRDTDTTMVTWTSATETGSLKTKNRDDDSTNCLGGSVNHEVDQKQEIIKAHESGQSHLTRRSRIPSVHNQSERRRRDKINQKIKALQKLVPNSSKTDKASMLEEVIEYLKRLQAHVHEMTMAMPQGPINHELMTMMMPAAMAIQHQQQQLQMYSLFASMGMGLGMGTLDMNPAAHATTSPPQNIAHPLLHCYPNMAETSSRGAFVQPPFGTMPPMRHTQSTSTPAASSNHIHSQSFNSSYS